MISTPLAGNARDYLTALAASGRYHFTSRDARQALGVSAAAARQSLSRLAGQGHVASPARGFYVIVPPEYRSLGCLPAEQFVPALMDHLKKPYYAGLLTAAQYYGAAHQRPQEFQVVVEGSRRPLVCGRVRVAYISRKAAAVVPVQSFNTPRGVLRVSTPEATALDLVGYARRAGGLGGVALVLSELAERIDGDSLAVAAATAPVAWAQRLGYLLERVGESRRTGSLQAYVRKHARQSTVLMPGGGGRVVHVADWKLYVNADVEMDL